MSHDQWGRCRRKTDTCSGQKAQAKMLAQNAGQKALLIPHSGPPGSQPRASRIPRRDKFRTKTLILRSHQLTAEPVPGGPSASQRQGYCHRPTAYLPTFSSSALWEKENQRKSCEMTTPGQNSRRTNVLAYPICTTHSSLEQKQRPQSGSTTCLTTFLRST